MDEVFAVPVNITARASKAAAALSKLLRSNPHVGSFVHVAVGTVLLVSLFLVTVFIYQSTAISPSQKNVVFMVTLGLSFIVSRHCNLLYRFTSWFFTHPAVLLIGFIALSDLNSSSAFRTILEKYPTTFNAIIQHYEVANRVLSVQFMSSEIRFALCIISIIMIHIFSSLRERRTSITITYRMILLSIGVIFYHLWMIEYVYFKWAFEQSFYSQFLLSLNIGSYILHSAYQMEFLFNYLKNGEQVNSRWSTLQMTALSIFFNLSMLIHFSSIILTWRSELFPSDYHLLVIVSSFEIFHRMLAIYVFGRLLLNCLRVTDAEEEKNTHIAANELHRNIPIIFILGERSTKKSYTVFGLPSTKDHIGTMISGFLSSPTLMPSRKDFSNQDSAKKCYTATSLEDVEPFRREPIPLENNFYMSIAVFAVYMPQSTEELWRGIVVTKK